MQVSGTSLIGKTSSTAADVAMSAASTGAGFVGHVYYGLLGGPAVAAGVSNLLRVRSAATDILKVRRGSPESDVACLALIHLRRRALVLAPPPFNRIWCPPVYLVLLGWGGGLQCSGNV